ncbi:MAG TPA: c-type cytochrome [Gammaproteobacteria bacterium]
MKKTFFVLTAAIVIAANAAYAAGDAAAGKTKAAACAACHGADGNSSNPEWPKIAGQHAKYVENQLRDFKSGERENPVMAPMAAPLSDQDMADLSAYYASVPRSGGFTSEDKAALGKKIYRGGNADSKIPACMACHGPTGAGDPLAGVPALSGQHAKYTAMQLNAYRNGARKNDDKSMMREVAKWMTAEEIEAVSEYIAGLH